MSFSIPVNFKNDSTTSLQISQPWSLITDYFQLPWLQPICFCNWSWQLLLYTFWCPWEISYQINPTFIQDLCQNLNRFYILFKFWSSLNPLIPFAAYALILFFIPGKYAWSLMLSIVLSHPKWPPNALDCSDPFIPKWSLCMMSHISLLFVTILTLHSVKKNYHFVVIKFSIIHFYVYMFFIRKIPSCTFFYCEYLSLIAKFPVVHF